MEKIDFIDFIGLMTEVLGPTMPRMIRSTLLKSNILRSVNPKDLPEDTGDLLLEAARRCYLRIFPRALSTDLPSGYEDANGGIYFTNTEAIADSFIPTHQSTITEDETGPKELLIPIRVFTQGRKTVWFFTPKEIVNIIHQALSFVEAKVMIVSSPINYRGYHQHSFLWDAEISHLFPSDYNHEEFNQKQIRSIFSQLLLANAFRPGGPVSQYPDVLAFFMNYEHLYQNYGQFLKDKKKYDITRFLADYFEKKGLKFKYIIVPNWTCSNGHVNKMNYDIEILNELREIINVYKNQNKQQPPVCQICKTPKRADVEGSGSAGEGSVQDIRWEIIGRPKKDFRISRKFFPSFSSRT
jgi:hypothetical protein